VKNRILLAVCLFLTGTCLFGAGNGLKGEYFNDTGLLGTPALTRTDATVNFEWAIGGPGLGIDDNFFSARWTGQVEASATGAFRFSTVSNNGVRLWVNNVEVINHWSAHANDKDTSAPMNLTAGQKYDLKMEFYENTNIATARLFWTPPGQAEAVVPQERLYSSAITVPALAPVYLSSLTPTSQSNGWGPYQRDRSNGEQGASDGRILSIGGINFARGLGVHAHSELHYALQGKFQSFLAQVGVDDEVGNRGSVAFEVWLDGVRVFASPILHGTGTAQPVNVSVAGKSDLKLVVLDGGNGIDYDHADWADAHLTAASGMIAIPAVPQNVSAVAGDRHVRLSWSASPGANSYDVYRGTSANGEATDPIVGGLTDTSFNDTGLTNGTKYYYRVIAVNSAGMSARSSEVSGTPGGNGGGGGTPPPAPSGLTGIGGDKQVMLTWSTSAGATSYSLFLGMTANGEASTPVRTGITGNSFTATGLTNGIKYFFKLAAMNGGNISAMSNETSATPAGAPLPPAPSGLTSKAGDKQVVLTWTAIPTAGATYNIFRGTTSNGEASVAVAGGLTSPTFTSMGLTNGTTYFFKVTASLGGVSSAMSNETSATPAGAPPPPAPSGLTSTAGDKQVVLSWIAIPTAGATYSVFRGTATNAESSTAVATGLTSPAFTNTGLTNGIPYFFKVTASVAGVSSAMSTETSATPAGAPPPPAPSGLTSTAGDKQVVLAWTAIPTAGATYSVFRGTATNAESNAAVATGLTSPAFTNTGLTNGTTYFFKVTASVAGVSSAMSNETSAAPAPPPPPPSPTGLTATPGDKQVVLAWTPIATPGATYSVFRGTTSNGESSTAIATALTSPAFTNTGLTNGTTYFFKVTAVVANVSSAMSTEASATPAPPSAPTGVSATPGDKQVILSWNTVAGAVSYNVYRGTTANGESGTALATGLTTATFTNTGLTNGTTYFYKVAAVNAANTVGTKSAEASAMPTAPGLILTQAQQDAFKFLRQSTFGPTSALVDHVVAIGKPAFIDEQIALPPTAYPDTLIQMPNMELVSEQFFQNAISGQDQLRQRVAWALSQIFVTSAIKVDNTDAMVPYIRMLEASAFGNVKTIMHDVSLSPAMGEFLDMVNNKKFDPATGALPNENYAREWLQLFSIGLVQLQNNGQPVAGNPATYDQSTVADMARVLTGWTYGDTKATNPTNTNPPFYGGPMKPVEKYHDTGAKTILGVSFPAGQTTQADFDMALNTVFNHPNVGPFLVRELIQRLVTSNPSPTYISDVAAVFNNNGQGVRGDLAAVVKAILLHPEASTTGSATFGKFAEPALFLTTVCRLICTNITDHPFMSDFSQNMAQQIWFAPSVFNYFSPNFRAGALFAPELQIWSTANAMTRTNWLASLLSGGFGGSVTLNLAPFTVVAADPNALTDTVNALLMGGTMSTQMRGAMITAISATNNTTERVNTALYVAASSMQYQVEH
jgi:uncharacterized protein (DUF1800 family)